MESLRNRKKSNESLLSGFDGERKSLNPIGETGSPTGNDYVNASAEYQVKTWKRPYAELTKNARIVNNTNFRVGKMTISRSNQTRTIHSGASLP